MFSRIQSRSFTPLLVVFLSVLTLCLCPSEAASIALASEGAPPPLLPPPPSLDAASQSSSSSSSSSLPKPSLGALFPPSGLVSEGVLVSGLVFPPPPPPPPPPRSSPPPSPPPESCVKLELRSAEGVVQDSKTVCLDGNEPAPYLLYSSSSSGADPSAGAFLGAACPAPLMLLATTTTAATTAKAKAAKKNKSSPKLSWSRALAPSGSAAFLHVDWVGAEEVFEEQQSGGQEPVWTFAAPAFAAGAAVAAAATLLLLPKEGRSPTENDGKGEDDHKGAEDRKRQETQKREEAEARWARDGGGAGRLSKVRAAADAAGGDGAG